MVDWKKFGKSFNATQDKPGGFVEELSEAIDSLFLSPEQRTREVGNVGPQAPGPDPFAQDVEQIQGLIQRGRAGFRTIDIDSFQLSQENYRCQVPETYLNELLGYENPIPGSGSPTRLQFWRTVEIPFQGNFLKVEYLPSRVNITGAVPVIRDQSSNPVDYSAGTPAGNDYTLAIASKSPILVQFEENTGPCHISNGSTSFKTPFSRVYVSFHAFGGPRIRVTIGFNTEVQDEQDKSLNADLAMGPGIGLFGAPGYHAVPFSISSENYSTNIAARYSIVNTTPTSLDNQLIRGGTASTDVNNGIFNDYQGVAVLWITGVSAQLHTTSAPVGGLNSFQLCLAIQKPIAPTYSTSTYRKIWTKTVLPLDLTGVADDRRFNIDISFEKPARVCLRNRETLNFLMINPSGANVAVYNITYDVRGYSYGGLKATGAAGSTAPVLSVLLLSEHPYPMDELV